MEVCSGRRRHGAFGGPGTPDARSRSRALGLDTVTDSQATLDAVLDALAQARYAQRPPNLEPLLRP